MAYIWRPKSRKTAALQSADQPLADSSLGHRPSLSPHWVILRAAGIKQLAPLPPTRYEAAMSWQVERDGSALHVRLAPPLSGEWEVVMDAVQANLDPLPLAIYLPSRIAGGSDTDADMLKMLWNALGSIGIPLLPPT